MNKVYDDLQDEKIRLIRELRIMSATEIIVCIALLLSNNLMFKVIECTVISSIGLVASIVCFIVTSYFYKKWTKQARD